MIKLSYVPQGKEDIIRYYGRPETIRGRLKKFDLPFPMRISYNKQEVHFIYMHPLIGAAVVDAYREFYEKVGLERIKANDWDLWAGCYNPRNKRGSNDISTHALAIAIDQCPELGGMGEDPSNMPPELVEAFKKRGFEWGGDWANIKDGMHFQACTGY